MRALSSAFAVTVAAAASLLLAPAAYANGDNGTVKIHDATTGEWQQQNQPKVCTFYLDGFGFDAQQKVSWKIVGMPPTGSRTEVAEVGDLTLDDEGHLRSETLSLQDGHYKLVWTFDGERGRAKHKVFWVDCDGTPEEDEASPEPVSSGPAETMPEPKGSSDPSPVAGEADTDGDGPEPSGTGADLAETGASVPAGALAAAAASLLGAGTYLVLRRRNTRSQQS
ncbi:hypothetical protein [Streptomyces sp. TR06-5]|uniref:hypothetical protein n=1 Tax=unclassified Streptomyces TaxID=2593676 RepID=UPI0039A1EBAD